MFDKGIKAELSGCAGLAGLKKLLKQNQVEFENKDLKIVVLISGGNVTVEELVRLYKQ